MVQHGKHGSSAHCRHGKVRIRLSSWQPTASLPCATHGAFGRCPLVSCQMAVGQSHLKRVRCAHSTAPTSPRSHLARSLLPRAHNSLAAKPRFLTYPKLVAHLSSYISRVQIQNGTTAVCTLCASVWANNLPQKHPLMPTSSFLYPTRPFLLRLASRGSVAFPITTA